MRYAKRNLCVASGLVFGLGVFASSPSAAGLAETKLCRKSVSTQARSYVQKRKVLLLSCIDKLLKCELQLEIEGLNPNTCRDRAVSSCTSRIGPQADSTLNRAITRFQDRATLACLVVGITDVLSASAGGLWYANDASCGTSVDLPTLFACVREELDSEVDAAVGGIKPRGALLLDNVGLGDSFPNLPRPPTTSLVISATASGSGVLVDPGTINVPLGNSITVSGDASTLPCGGSSNNGRLTVTVQTSEGTQEQQIKEPFGPTQTAVFGPFVEASDPNAPASYSVDLKDGSCDDTVSGAVSIP